MPRRRRPEKEFSVPRPACRLEEGLRRRLDATYTYMLRLGLLDAFGTGFWHDYATWCAAAREAKYSGDALIAATVLEEAGLLIEKLKERGSYQPN